WENTTTPYTHLRVTNGTHTTDINLTTLTPPTPLPTANYTIDVTAFNGSKNVSPRANGLDQAPVNTEIKVSGEQVDEGVYKRLYYRDDRNFLITGLFSPEHPDQYTAVTPLAGAYANDGRQSASASGPVQAYVTTTNLSDNKVSTRLYAGRAEYGSAKLPVVVRGDGAVPRAVYPGNKLQAVSGNNVPRPLTQADAAKPALFFLGGNIGLQLNTAAITSTGSLPLFKGSPLGRSPVTVDRTNNTQATVETNTFGPGETFSTVLVTRGDAVNADQM
ncbi:hypothetical protein, partial [Streptomyces sp. NPDC057910]|uniref:hypothetical protein n=1 Tax=Streptomyces sp. NPDC057910 TaxID=3346278 RepID=UPI0036EC4C38